MYIETKISLSLSFSLLSVPFICNLNVFSYMSLSYILLDKKIQLQISRIKLVRRSHYILPKKWFYKRFYYYRKFHRTIILFSFTFFLSASSLLIFIRYFV